MTLQFLQRTSSSHKTYIITLFGYVLCLLSWAYFSITQEPALLSSPTNQNYYFEPVFSNVIKSFFVDYINDTLFVFLTHIIIPISIFIFMVEIFKRFVHENWAVFLTLVGLSFYQDYPFRYFLHDIISGKVSFDLANIPVIVFFPFPGLSVFFAVLILYVCSPQQYISSGRALLSSILIGLLFYVHALNAAFLLAFWASFYAIRCLRQYGLSRLAIQKTLVQLSVVFGIIIWGLLNSDFTVITIPNSHFTPYYFFAYALLPILLIAMLILTRRVDIRELQMRFTPVFILMSLELSFILGDLLELLPINYDFLSLGLGQFFLHPFYYLPIIHFFSRGVGDYQSGFESLKIIKEIAKISQYVFVGFENYLMFPFIALLLFYQCRWTLSLLV